MSAAMAEGLLFAVAAYAAIGSILAVPLLAFGLGRIDPAAKAAPWTFRVLVLPGVVALWPFLVRRWFLVRAGR